jgi:hypothetical protein
MVVGEGRHRVGNRSLNRGTRDVVQLSRAKDRACLSALLSSHPTCLIDEIHEPSRPSTGSMHHAAFTA